MARSPIYNKKQRMTVAFTQTADVTRVVLSDMTASGTSGPTPFTLHLTIKHPGLTIQSFNPVIVIDHDDTCVDTPVIVLDHDNDSPVITLDHDDVKIVDKSVMSTKAVRTPGLLTIRTPTPAPAPALAAASAGTGPINKLMPSRASVPMPLLPGEVMKPQSISGGVRSTQISRFPFMSPPMASMMQSAARSELPPRAPTKATLPKPAAIARTLFAPPSSFLTPGRMLQGDARPVRLPMMPQGTGGPAIVVDDSPPGILRGGRTAAAARAFQGVPPRRLLAPPKPLIDDDATTDEDVIAFASSTSDEEEMRFI